MRPTAGQEVFVAHHALKHGLSAEDIKFAWCHFLFLQYRGSPHEGEMVAIGPRRNEDLIQMVGTEAPIGIVIFHALEPPTGKVLRELGLTRRL